MEPKKSFPPIIDSWVTHFATFSQIPVSFLSTMAAKHRGVLSFALTAIEDVGIIEGMGAHMKTGALRVKFTDGQNFTAGKLGARTAEDMRGGFLWIDGDVKRISNVFGGTILVNGDITELFNIAEGTCVICTGSMGGHLYAATNSVPSSDLYCANESSEFQSISAKSWAKKVANAEEKRLLHYIKVNKHPFLHQFKKDLSNVPTGTLQEREVAEIFTRSLGYKDLLNKLCFLNLFYD